MSDNWSARLVRRLEILERQARRWLAAASVIGGARASQAPWRRSARLAVTGLALLLATPHFAVSAQSAADRLDELVQQYVQQQSSGRSSRGADALSAAAFEASVAADRRLLAAVVAVPASDLGSAEAIDRELLAGLLAASIDTAEARRSWENDPSLYVPSSRLSSLLQSDSPLPAPERARRLSAALQQLPARFEHGVRNLKRPPARFTEAALFQAEQTLESLRAAVPALVAGGGAAGDELQGAAAIAVPALEAFVAFLRDDLLPRSDGDWALGREHYDFILQQRWFLDDDVDSILERGLQAFRETEAEAQRIADRMAPGKHWVEVYEALKDEHPPADGLKQAYQEQMDAARDFLIAHDVVTLPAGERVITVDTPPAMRRSSPFGTFRTVGPFDEGLEGRLVLTPVEDWMSAEQRRERLRSHHLSWVPIIAVHEAYPGHHVAALKANENPRLLRRVVRESIFSEGWGLFTEQLMFELGFLQGDDVRLTVLRNRLWRAARVILDVSLHTGRMSIAEAVDFLVERVRFERYAAELEVGMYPRRPTYVLGYLIGMQEIEAIRDDWVRAFGQPQPPSRLYDRLLSVGAIPPALVRRELLDDSAAVGPGR